MFVRTVQQLICSVKMVAKPLSIHCEVQHIPQFQVALKNFLFQHKNRYGYAPILYCVTPVNKAYVEGLFGSVNEDFAETLENAYLSLKEDYYNIQLHVHLTRKPNLLSFQQKKQVVLNAYEWMRNIGVYPTELVLGWWSNESDIETVGNQLGLRLMRKDSYRVIHDYELVMK